MAPKRRAEPAEDVDDDDNELAISQWAIMRKRKLPKAKWTLTENIAFDPLAYTIMRYVNLPMACDQQMKISELRKQLILNYRTNCRAKPLVGESTSTVIMIYAQLIAKPETVKDTCKLLHDDLRLFFMHDDSKQTMSPCMFPSIFDNRRMLTPEFFQTPDWREHVKRDVRLIPSGEKKALFDRVFDPTAEWNLDKTKPFDNERLEEGVRLPMVKLAAHIKELVHRAYGLEFSQDRGRELLILSASKQLRELAARIDNLADVGVDGAVSLKGYEEEREIQESCDTIRVLARFSLEIKTALGINMPV